MFVVCWKVGVVYKSCPYWCYFRTARSGHAHAPRQCQHNYNILSLYKKTVQIIVQTSGALSILMDNILLLPKQTCKLKKKILEIWL